MKDFLLVLLIAAIAIFHIPAGTEARFKAHCASHSGYWSEFTGTTFKGSFEFGACSADITEGQRRMPRGYIFVLWNKDTGEAQIND